MNRIKDIYYGFINSKEYQRLESMLEVAKAENEFNSLLEGLSYDMAFEIDDKHGECISNYEMQGFIYGFRYGVQLISECFSKDGGETI